MMMSTTSRPFRGAVLQTRTFGPVRGHRPLQYVWLTRTIDMDEENDADDLDAEDRPVRSREFISDSGAHRSCIYPLLDAG